MWTFTFQFFLSNDLFHPTLLFLPRTLASTGCSSSQISYSNLPLVYLTTGLLTSPLNCPPLLFFSLSLKFRVHYSSHSCIFSPFTWPTLVLPQHLMRFQASNTQLRTFYVIYTSHEHCSSCTAIVLSILLDLLMYNFNYFEVQYFIYLWIWLC